MIGIIGGSGVYDISLLENVKEVEVKTPFGEPSSAITVGDFQGKKIAFLARHGKSHSIAPHKVNYRANIWALKEMGVKVILAPCAVGSMKEEIKAGDFVFAENQIIVTGEEITELDSQELIIDLYLVWGITLLNAVLAPRDFDREGRISNDSFRDDLTVFLANYYQGTLYETEVVGFVERIMTSGKIYLVLPAVVPFVRYFDAVNSARALLDCAA